MEIFCEVSTLYKENNSTNFLLRIERNTLFQDSYFVKQPHLYIYIYIRVATFFIKHLKIMCVCWQLVPFLTHLVIIRRYEGSKCHKLMKKIFNNIQRLCLTFYTMHILILRWQMPANKLTYHFYKRLQS